MMTGRRHVHRCRVRARYAASLLLAWLVVAADGLVSGGVPRAADGSGVSEANGLLFQTRHLEGLESPVTLHYRLEAAGGDNREGFTDDISVTIRPSADSPDWHAEFDYLSGERKRHVPSVSGATGNPIIKIFLQREVIEMEQLTGGDWRYFQKAIKASLEESATVSQVRFPYDGQEVDGVRVEVVPYRDDPRRERIGAYAGMRYAVVLSDDVPGQVYELEATTATGNKSESEPVFAETVTLRRAEVAER